MKNNFFSIWNWCLVFEFDPMSCSASRRDISLHWVSEFEWGQKGIQGQSPSTFSFYSPTLGYSGDATLYLGGLDCVHRIGTPFLYRTTMIRRYDDAIGRYFHFLFLLCDSSRPLWSTKQSTPWWKYFLPSQAVFSVEYGSDSLPAFDIKLLDWVFFFR